MSENEDLNDEAWDESEDGEPGEELGDDEQDELEAADGASPDKDSGERRRPRRDDDYQPADDRARQALKFMQDVIREMEMECRVRLRRPQEGNAEDEINIEISGRDAGRIIGK